LWSSAEVGDAIVNDVLESCASARAKEPDVKPRAISNFAPKN
jgi:hypothetical protein